MKPWLSWNVEAVSRAKIEKNRNVMPMTEDIQEFLVQAGRLHTVREDKRHWIPDY